MCQFVNLDERDEATCIDTMVLLHTNCLKQWLLFPILSLLTIFIFPLIVYWRPALNARYRYSTHHSINTASHVLIRGRCGLH